MAQAGSEVSLRQFCLPNFCLEIVEGGGVLRMEQTRNSQRKWRCPQNRAYHFYQSQSFADVRVTSAYILRRSACRSFQGALGAPHPQVPGRRSTVARFLLRSRAALY
jgi:hypothetical protein